MVVLVLLLGLTAGNAAQEFQLDVVSVRASGGERPQTTFGPGRMALVDWTLYGLVNFAFSPPARLIEGWPDPRLQERRFTVAATYSGAGTPALAVQQRLVREILEDRFGLRARIEQREQAIYALRLIKPGVLGPGVVELNYNCMDPETRAKRTAEDCPQSGDRVEDGGMFWRGSGPIAVLVPRLEVELRRGLGRGASGPVVVDQTGLDRFYRFELLLWEGGLSRPSVRDLLPAQMGMLIQDTRAPVDVVIVDAISMPTPN